MGIDVMNCCGALTKVYGDQGRRKHKEGCDLAEKADTCPHCSHDLKYHSGVEFIANPSDVESAYCHYCFLPCPNEP
jgi:hypothetical protein